MLSLNHLRKEKKENELFWLESWPGEFFEGRFLENNSLAKLQGNRGGGGERKKMSKKNDRKDSLHVLQAWHRAAVSLGVSTGTSWAKNFIFAEVNARNEFHGEYDFPPLWRFNSIDKSLLHVCRFLAEIYQREIIAKSRATSSSSLIITLIQSEITLERWKLLRGGKRRWGTCLGDKWP